MNAYLIVCGDRKFCTDANDMMEAEEKFLENYYGVSEDFRINQVDIDAVKNDPSVTFF